ncbi:MAG: HEAT repeat domain-containing protein [Deltaproteobacteria bacterium]|nr:HEAT repeat domain-containing protein [Deltaproteobacteria bacterium]
MTARALSWNEAEQARVAEVRRLAALGSGAAPRLLDQLDEPSWTVRREVAAAVIALGGSVTTLLCDLLRTRRDSESRIAAAVDCLVALDADVIVDLELLAADPDPAVAADAAQILGRRRAERGMPVLQRLVAHADDNVAVAALEGIGRIGGGGAFDTLVEATRGTSFFRVFPAIGVLGRTGDPRAIARLSAMLADPLYAAEAARALGLTGQLTAVPTLASLLASSMESVARAAAGALAHIGEAHREKYGTDDAVDEALRRGVADAEPVVVRLQHALGAADTQEHTAIVTILGAIGGEHVVACLRALLVHPKDGDVAAQALQKIGRDADVAVRDALKNGTSGERRVLLPRVARATSVDEIVACLQDPEPDVRVLACEALMRAGARQAVSAIFVLLGDEKPSVVQAATAAIQALGSNETKALALIAAQGKNPALRRTGLRVLGFFGFPEALPVFLAALLDDDPRAREAAMRGLALLDDVRAIDALALASASPEPQMRSAALRALGTTGRKEDARIVGLLRGALRDPDPWVRYYACQALGRLVTVDAVDEIAACLRDGAGQVRVAAIEALARLQTNAAFQALRWAAESDDADVRRAAVLGLGSDQRAEALVVLLRAAGNADPATRLVAIAALHERSPAGAIPMLHAAAARDGDENVRAAALAFLAALGGAESTAVLVDLLRAALKSDGPHLPIAAALSRPLVGRVDGILTALVWVDDATASVLTSCLARQGSVESTSALVMAMKIPSTAARRAAATALGNLRTSAAFAALRGGTADLDPDVRRICQAVIERWS